MTVVPIRNSTAPVSNAGDGSGDDDEVLVHETNTRTGSGKTMKKDTHRLHLALPEKAVDAIMILQDRLEASTTSEAIRRSLFLALKITEAVENGGTVVIEKPDGSRQKVLIG